MTGRKYDYVEERTDRNGIRRTYGYRPDGTVVLLNAAEVMASYRARGLKGFAEAV